MWLRGGGGGGGEEEVVTVRVERSFSAVIFFKKRGRQRLTSRNVKNVSSDSQVMRIAIFINMSRAFLDVPPSSHH